MTSRGLTTLLIRTVLVLVVAVVVLTIVGWSWFGTLALSLLGSAALIQLAGVLWLRRQEKSDPSGGKPLRK